MNEMNEIKFNKEHFSHYTISDVLIVYLKEKKANGKNYFYICDKEYGLRESEDKKCYVVKLSHKG